MRLIKNRINYLLSIAILVVLLSLVSCSKKKHIKNTIDPYAQSFWGRGIKTMIAKNCLDSTCLAFDTLVHITHFNTAGDRITEQTSFSIRKLTYDSNHFIIRDWNRTDVLENFVYSYQYDNKTNYILAYRTELNHIKWEFTEKDLLPRLTDTITLQLDNNHNIISERSTSKNKLIAQYFYNDNLLYKKVSYFYDSINETTTYSYLNHTLSEITITGHMEPVVIKHYFSREGVLHHSTRELFGRTRVTMYDFEFY